MPNNMTGPEAIKRYCQGEISPRPEYYSGRGVSTYDLGPDHLNMIYNGLKNDFGEEVSATFCKMVESLTDMSATNFLNQFYFFFNSGKKWDEPKFENRIDVGPDNDCRETIASLSIFSVLGRKQDSNRDQMIGESIKRMFFDEIGYEPTKPMQRFPVFYDFG